MIIPFYRWLKQLGKQFKLIKFSWKQYKTETKPSKRKRLKSATVVVWPIDEPSVRYITQVKIENVSQDNSIDKASKPTHPGSSTLH